MGSPRLSAFFPARGEKEKGLEGHYVPVVVRREGPGTGAFLLCGHLEISVVLSRRLETPAQRPRAARLETRTKESDAHASDGGTTPGA